MRIVKDHFTRVEAARSPLKKQSHMSQKTVGFATSQQQIGSDTGAYFIQMLERSPQAPPVAHTQGKRCG
jgi:hypothetical protein